MGTCNRRVKFGLKIPNRLGKKCQKISGGLTHAVDATKVRKIKKNVKMRFYEQVSKRDFLK